MPPADRPCADFPKSVLCYDDPNARILMGDVAALINWIDEVLVRCGPTPEPKKE